MEQKTTVTSKQYQINIKDFLRGALLTVITSVLAFAETSMEAGNFVFDWKMILKVAGLTFVSYLLKNYFQPATLQTKMSNAEVDQIKTDIGTDTTAK